MNCNNNCYRNKPQQYMQNCICLDELPLGMAYVPWQKWDNVMCAKDGYSKGSIFSDLIYPFYGCNGKFRR